MILVSCERAGSVVIMLWSWVNLGFNSTCLDDDTRKLVAPCLSFHATALQIFLTLGGTAIVSTQSRISETPVLRNFRFENLALVILACCFMRNLPFIFCTGDPRAAAVVGKVKPSTLLDKTSGRVAEAARDSAAAVIGLLRSAGNRRGEIDAGLLAVRAQLTRDAVHSQVFQAQLLLALRHEESANCEGKCAGIGEPALALYWRLHESGLLPFSKMLEANEALPSLALGHQRGGDGQRQCGEHTIVSGMRALALQSARRPGDTNSPQEDATAVIVSDVAKHLFDVAYRTLSPGSEPIASRAARAVLDQLCCGQEMFG